MIEQEQNIKVDIKNMLGVTTWETDASENAHITIEESICNQCEEHWCMTGCPAECFTVIDGKVFFQYEDCVECGTCNIMCPNGSVKWNNPRGSYGVKYLQG